MIILGIAILVFAFWLLIAIPSAGISGSILDGIVYATGVIIFMAVVFGLFGLGFVLIGKGMAA